MSNPAQRFLFLQGPPGRFFSRLADTLRSAGHVVHRVNFHGGDVLDWPAEGAMSWRGRTARWPAWLTERFLRLGITDLVLFGDCRPLHGTAIDVARRHNVRVHVFEEGYLRPDWVTLERDGVNGHSSLPRDPAWFRETANGLPPKKDCAPVPGNFRERARSAFAYYFAAWISWPLYPNYTNHRPYHPALELVGWAEKFLRRQSRVRDTTRQLARIADQNYFLFPLQLDSDYQLRVHSPFGGIGSPLKFVIRSFAQHAPQESVLAIKSHPLDNGVVNWRAYAEREALRLGIVDRVVWFDGGDIDLLSRGARGMVTVNSTIGTLALAAGVPVCVLGTAVYDIAGITDQQTLEGFWQSPRAPDPALFDAFRRVLIDRCLFHGGFHNNAAIDIMITPVCARLLANEDAREIRVQAESTPAALQEVAA